MKKYFLLLLLLPLSLLAQDRPELAVAFIPSNIRENANAVIRQEYIEFTVSAPDRAKEYVRRSVTLFNDKSHFDQLYVIYDDHNKLGKMRGWVYDAQGRLLRELRKSEVRDQSAISGSTMYSDTRVRYLELEKLDYPVTLIFEYEMSYKHLQGYPGWSAGEFAVGTEKAELVIKLPVGFGLTYRARNLQAEPTITTEGEMQRYRWLVQNLPPVKAELYSPTEAELLPEIDVAPGTFEVEGYQGSMASWQDYGLFMDRLWEGRQELSVEMKETVQQLTANAASDREKIDLIYRFLQQNMRYVSVQLGIGGWQTFDAKYVEENKFGDCKALSNFTMAMLREAGVEASPALIFWGDSPPQYDEDFVATAFNHVILYVPSEDYWLECTSGNAPPNYLGSGTDDRNVLIFNESGGHLARTPVLTTARNQENNTLLISLENTGSAVLDLTAERTGERQEYYRYFSLEISKEELQKYFQAGISLPSFTLEKLEVVPDPNLPKATVTCQATVPRFASKAGKRLFVPLNPMNAFTDIPPATEQRQHPIVRQRGYVETDRITLQLPDGYDVESMPTEPLLIESEHANYSLQVTQSDGTVTVERRFEVLPCRMPAEQYEAWREIYKQIAKADAGKLVLVSRT